MKRIIKSTELLTKFPKLWINVIGSQSASVDNVTPPDQSNASSIVFVVDEKLLGHALESASPIVVVPPPLKSAVETFSKEHEQAQRLFLVTKDVKFAMALVKKEYFGYETPIQKLNTIHSSAVISPTAKIGKNVTVGPHSVIGENVIVEDGVRIDACVVVEADAVIRKDTHIYSQVYIGPRTEIGERCELLPLATIGAEGFGFAHDDRGKFYRIPQSGKVVLENDVEIGSSSTIDRATFGVTLIGEGTKLDKQCHVAHNCQIGKHTAIAASFAVAGSTKIGSHCIFGGRITMRDNITVTDGVQLAAASGVHNHITESGKYGGHPLQPIMDSMRTIKTMAHLPKMRKQISKIMKHLGMSEEDSDS